MRKLYDEFFYIPKYGKIREKVMLTRMAMTIVIMVVCLAAMGITAYAYFSYNVTSGPNTIKAANFEAKVSITSENPIAVTKDGEVQTANLNAGNYTIELSKGNSTSDKGFCVITIGEKKYYTDQIGVDAEKNLTDAVVKFDLQLSAPAKMKVCSHWGTSVYYGYEDADRTEIFIENDSTLDLTTKTLSDDGDLEEDTDQPEEEPTDTPTESDTSSPQPSENTATSSTETIESEETTLPETTEPSEPTETTESSDLTEPSEPEITPNTESSESAETESTETESAKTEAEVEDTETTDTPTDETNE